MTSPPTALVTLAQEVYEHCRLTINESAARLDAETNRRAVSATIAAQKVVKALSAAPRADAPADLVQLVREWQEARKPATLVAPGEFLAETYQAAVKRMAAADEALAVYDLNGPAGGALVGQTAPTESTGPYLCACTCGCGDRTIRPGRCMVCRVREGCLKNEWTCEACAAGYRLAADGMHYDHDDATWGVCRKVVASFRREEP